MVLDRNRNVMIWSGKTSQTTIDGNVGEEELLLIPEIRFCKPNPARYVSQ